HAVVRNILAVSGALGHPDRSCAAVTCINPVPLDVLPGQERNKGRQAAFIDGAASEEGSDILGKIFAFGVQDVVNECHRNEGPENQEGSCSVLGGTTKTLTPVAGRGGVSQSRLLHLQQHAVERREIAKSYDEIQQRLVVLTLGVEPRVKEQLIEQGLGGLVLE